MDLKKRLLEHVDLVNRNMETFRLMEEKEQIRRKKQDEWKSFLDKRNYILFLNQIMHGIEHQTWEECQRHSHTLSNRANAPSSSSADSASMWLLHGINAV
jgi:hypothetical protein